MKTEAEKRIQEHLFAMGDGGYREFSAKLTPNVAIESIIGVRTPALRTYAKEIAGTDDARAFLRALPHEYYDENNLHGFLIERMKDFDETVEAIDRFLPYVDNWATCDLCSPKVFRKHHKELLPYIERWIDSGETYTVRFGIGMLLSNYLDEHFSVSYLERIASIRSDEYYINMMIAWFFATALAKQYEATLPYIEGRMLDGWTHNKAIQKAVESRRVTPSQKEYLRSLKIKQ